MNYEELKQMLDEKEKIEYPKIGYIEKNYRYANMLYDDLSGELGELSAVTQYVYEHMNINDNSNISRIMLLIAIEEMKHLNMIGELIKKLGKNPYFISSNEKKWKSGNVNYNLENLYETMKYNISTEEAAIRGYRKAMINTRNMQIRRLLNRIILDEETHIKIFRKIMEDSIKNEQKH